MPKLGAAMENGAETHTARHAAKAVLKTMEFPRSPICAGKVCVNRWGGKREFQAIAAKEALATAAKWQLAAASTKACQMAFWNFSFSQTWKITPMV